MILGTHSIPSLHVTNNCHLPLKTFDYYIKTTWWSHRCKHCFVVTQTPKPPNVWFNLLQQWQNSHMFKETGIQVTFLSHDKPSCLSWTDLLWCFFIRQPYGEIALLWASSLPHHSGHLWSLPLTACTICKSLDHLCTIFFLSRVDKVTVTSKSKVCMMLHFCSRCQQNDLRGLISALL